MPVVESIASRPAPAASEAAEPRRVPQAAIVPVGRGTLPGAITVRVRGGMPLRHALMLALAVAVMGLGIVSSHRHPIRRAIIVIPPALQGAVVT